MTIEFWQFSVGVGMSIIGAAVSAAWAVGKIRSDVREIDSRVKSLEEHRKDSDHVRLEMVKQLEGISAKLDSISSNLTTLDKKFEAYRVMTDKDIKEFYKNNKNSN